MKGILMITCLLMSNLLPGQEIVNFENFNLAKDTFANGRDHDGGFLSGPIFLPNNYNADFDAWLGWSISSMSDTVTPGFSNQYSCIAGSGADSSISYAVGFAFDPIVAQIQDTQPYHINGAMINNATYPYISMRDGDAFSKKFGGVTGEDPDFFLLTIKAYANGTLSADSVDFFLADFRADAPTEDYIINKWTYVDLSSLGIFDSLQFTLSSSDNGIFGMNTPAFFCLDNLALSKAQSTSSSSIKSIKDQTIIYPNPAQSQLYILKENAPFFQMALHSLDGKLISKKHSSTDYLSLDIESLSQGMYLLKIVDIHGMAENKVFIKQ